MDDGLDYTPKTLAVEKARDRASEKSSQILDLIGIDEGKVTEPGPSVTPCKEDPEHLYRTGHPWSVYGVSSEEVLRKGFQRLREKLPRHGWKIVEYGPNSSKARTLELTADSTKDRYSLNVELRVSSPTAGKERNPLILVHVVSGCYRAPKGTKLDQEF
ncbi:hypothetical protein [Streptomyces physcomitrii]|uniref:Bacterial CdiA-CT RNAse A domain-containing protein n=1 Tax=Streptomyces physcomitrii TaxID=2724184 RepID=A0ABX1H8F8_9ACTN|nr:hypothetical protein [Streptomyces physcomitrii]NKI44651.1 hypothetical protein [Streptomyces physcomitrii]